MFFNFAPRDQTQEPAIVNGPQDLIDQVKDNHIQIDVRQDNEAFWKCANAIQSLINQDRIVYIGNTEDGIYATYRILKTPKPAQCDA